MKREIRSSSIAGVAGAGAIVDVGQESFLVPGIDQWKQQQLAIVQLKRLSSRLHKILKTPRAETPSLMVRRFPRSMFCEKCRDLVHWKTEFEEEDSEPACPRKGCGGKLVSMRFVCACENGHMDDVDWRFWAHSGSGSDRGCRSRDRLSFVVDPSAATGGLASVRVKCACGSSRSLEDLSNKGIIKETFRSCSGRHPWIYGKQEACDADVVVLQRGATNLHYPVTVSALDIPTTVAEGTAAQFAGQIREQPEYQKLLRFLRSSEGDTKDIVDMLAGVMARLIGCAPTDILEVAQADLEGRPLGQESKSAAVEAIDQAVLLDEEWQTIDGALREGGLASPGFSAVTEALALSAPPWMKRLIKGVLLVSRLREVRAYLGFQRVTPGAPERTVRPDVGASENWLPAAEVFGEGIVLAFDYPALHAWAQALPPAERAALEALENKRVDDNFWFLPKIDAVYLAVHTLSHLLLRRITFECGYSSSSLRERLYVNSENEYAAIMIYTADGDSEGSLGGLVRQGRKDRLAQSLIEAIDQGAWCSSDPVCSETAGQGLGGFNHAACHACSLVSETSCIAANTLLDRRMLFDPDWGLLRHLVRQS